MGTAVRPAKTSSGPWDAFADVDEFVDEVLAELTAMARDGTRPRRSAPKPPLAGAALRKAVMVIWCVCFCGMQWQAIGQLCDISFNTRYGLFARWTRLGLWRRLLDQLRRTWRRACSDTPEPSAVVIDSRSCRSAPSCFERGIDGGKKIRGVKIQIAIEKYGIPLIYAGICWVVERSFAWLSRYRRLNIIFERSKDHLIAFVAIAFISILSRRLKRLVVDEISA